MISRNGKSWGGTTLPGLDSDKRLMKPNGRARYTFNLDPTGSEISATIDASQKIRESNERNNSLSKSF
jgi:subtilase family serine protease